jgi:hypothetical protein
MAFLAWVLKQKGVSVLFNPDTFVEGIIDDVILQKYCWHSKGRVVVEHKVKDRHNQKNSWNGDDRSRVY